MTESEALAACAEITRREARNFHYGLRLLPPPERAALCAVYAWMRVLDDLADSEGRTPGQKRDDLEWFERATRRALDGASGGASGGASDGCAGRAPSVRETAVLVGIGTVASRYPIDRADILGAIEGQRADLDGVPVERFADAERYCDQVAATVGRICLSVWGVRSGADAAFARELSTRRGIAFQLVNILRDIREDRARGRCYLPADELAAAGLTVDTLLAWADETRCSRFMSIQCARAERIFAESAPLDGMVPVSAAPTIRAMSAIYRGILRRIARDPRAALARRVRLGPVEKTLIAVRARLGLLGGAP